MSGKLTGSSEYHESNIWILYLTGICAFLFGYFAAHVLFFELFIAYLGRGGGEEWLRGFIGAPWFQLLCGAPVAASWGFVLSVIVMQLKRFKEGEAMTRFLLLGIMGLLGGGMGYFLLQFLFMFLMAF